MAPAHPRDHSTLLRMWLRLPTPSSHTATASKSSALPIAASTADNDSSSCYYQEDDNDKNSNSNGNDDDNDDDDNGTQLQPVELCFHQSYQATGAANPVSLHFDTSSAGLQSVTRHHHHCVSPPSSRHVREFPSVLDLTSPDTHGPQLLSFEGRPYPKTPRRRLTSSACTLVACLLLALSAFLLARFIAANSQKAQACPSNPFFPTVSSDYPHFVVRHSTVNTTLGLYRQATHGQRLSLESIESLLEFVHERHNQKPSFFSDLRDDVDAVCLHAAVLMQSGGQSDDQLGRLRNRCAALHNHIWHATSLWGEMRIEGWWKTPAADSVRLRHAASLLSIISARNSAARLAVIYRDALFGVAAPDRLKSCNLCQALSSSSSSSSSSDPLDVSPLQWHFACEPGFAQGFWPTPPSRLHEGATPTSASQANATAHLHAWATRQVHRRDATLRDAPRDLDGEPLYPNNEHPVLEAEDVVAEAYVGEDITFALTRHLYELYTNVKDINALLAGHPLGAACADNAGAGAAAAAADDDQSIRDATSQPDGKGQASWGLGLGRIWHSFAGSSGEDEPLTTTWQRALCNSMRRLQDALEPLDTAAGAFGHASVGLADECNREKSLWEYLEAIESRGEPISWKAAVTVDGREAPAEGAAAAAFGWDQQTATIHVTWTRHTADADAEAAGLVREVDEMVDEFDRRRAAQPPRAPSEAPAPLPVETEYEDLPFESDEERAFVEGLERRWGSSGVQQLAEMLRRDPLKMPEQEYEQEQHQQHEQRNIDEE